MIFFFFFLFYVIQHSLICRPSDSTVSEDKTKLDLNLDLDMDLKARMGQKPETLSSVLDASPEVLEVYEDISSVYSIF